MDRPRIERARPRSGAAALPELDALRGVAIACVFAQHLGDRFLPMVEQGAAEALPAWLSPWVLAALYHAWWGVDLFFVLSGFTLALGYLHAFERGAPLGARVFWKRRAARILPAFWVAIAVHLAAHARVVLEPGFASSLLVHALLLQGYLCPPGIVIIGAAWSLTTEACFYVVMPALAAPLLAPARPLARRVTAGLAIALGAWLTRDLLHRAFLEPGVRTWALELVARRLAPSRLDEFVLGMLAAAVRARLLRSRLRERAQALAPIGLGLSLALLVASFRLEGALFFTQGGSWPYALMSLATAALVFSVTLAERPPGSGRAAAPLRALGVVSYGVFLYHQLALGVVGAVVPFAAGEPTWPRLGATCALALGASVALGYASYAIVERPAMRLAR